MNCLNAHEHGPFTASLAISLFKFPVAHLQINCFPQARLGSIVQTIATLQ